MAFPQRSFNVDHDVPYGDLAPILVHGTVQTKLTGR